MNTGESITDNNGPQLQAVKGTVEKCADSSRWSGAKHLASTSEAGLAAVPSEGMALRDRVPATYLVSHEGDDASLHAPIR